MTTLRIYISALARPATSAFYILFGNLISQYIEKYLISAYIIRQFGAQTSGSFVVGRTIASIFMTLSVGPTRNALMRGRSRGGKLNELVFSGTLVGAGLACTIATPILLMSGSIAQSLNAEVLVEFLPSFVLAAVFSILAQNLAGTFVIHNSLAKFAMLQVGGSVTLLPVILLADRGGIAGINLGYVLSAVGSLLLCGAVTWPKLSPHVRPPWAPVKRVLIDTIPFGAVLGLTQIMNSGDRLLVSVMFGAEAVTFYYIAVTTAFLFLAPLEALEGALLPVFVNHSATGSRISVSQLRAIVTIAAPVLVLLVALPLGPFIGELLYGTEKWERSLTLYWILVLGGVLSAMQCGSRSYIVAFGEPATSLKINAASTLLAGACWLIMGLSLGLNGIAGGTAVAIGVRGFLYVYASRRLERRIDRAGTVGR